MQKKNFLQFISFLKKLFLKKNKEIPLFRDIIGTARFEQQTYFFLRVGKDIFLVSDTQKRTYQQKIKFSKDITPYILTMKDLDAVTLPTGEHALVCTITFNKGYKTLYLVSDDTIHFKAWSMVKSPNGSPTKILFQPDKNIALITSIDGEICYRKLDVAHREIEYHNTGLSSRNDSFDHSPLSVICVFLIDDGIFILYDTSYEMRGFKTHRFGAALLAHDNLSHTHWRACYDEIPFWDHFMSKTGNDDSSLCVIGAYLNEDKIKVYFYEEHTKNIHTLDLHEPYSRRNPREEKAILKKYVNNPILKPNPEHAWENHTTFNPTAIQIDSKTHLLYRAEGSAGLSVVGYAQSYNGVSFDRLADPIYLPSMHFEGINVSQEIIQTHSRGSYKSGYNHYQHTTIESTPYHWHGVEDPRITELDGRLYMIYAAYNGYQQARPAITSIDKKDFLEKKWNWAIPQPMTDVPQHHGQGNKNVVLHPEKVNGKFMLYHRTWPHIRIDYVDDLEFGPNHKYLKEIDRIEARGDSWDSHKIAVAAAPLRIKEGWLLIYQGAGSNDRRYKVGAMILDYENPTKVLYRSNYPIMVPNQWYENEYKFGVAYPCGAVVRDGMLNIYYGGSDKYVCLAQAPLDEFVHKLKQDPYNKPILIHRKNINEICI
jgi:predicted GH43/DUF377 family glycosyl hydrolase